MTVVESIEEYEDRKDQEKAGRMAYLVANRHKNGLVLPASMVREHGGTPTPTEIEEERRFSVGDSAGGGDEPTGDEQAGEAGGQS